MSKTRLFVVVDGAYGSTAKGKTVQYLASHYRAGLGVRCGGPNAGHTIDWEDAATTRHRFVTRSLCSALANRNTTLAIAAGSVVDFGLLTSEIDDLQTNHGVDIASRLYVDSNAFIVQTDDVNYELSHNFGLQVGSTQTGTGAAAMRRIGRKRTSGGFDLMGDLAANRSVPFQTCSVPQLIRNKLDEGSPVIIEGTQGFGLDMYHSGFWPFCTSRSTTASAFCAEAGVSPLDVTDVVMVVRTHPIRVGGNSGPIRHEIDWPTVASEAEWPPDQLPTEITSVTKKVRRVGRFDWDLHKRALVANRPTALALHGVDYLNWADRGRLKWDQISNRTKTFVAELEVRSGGVPVRWVMTGPQGDQIIDRWPDA